MTFVISSLNLNVRGIKQINSNGYSGKCLEAQSMTIDALETKHQHLLLLTFKMFEKPFEFNVNFSVIFSLHVMSHLSGKVGILLHLTDFFNQI